MKWKRVMMDGKTSDAIRYVGTMGSMGMKVASLLILSLERSEITEEMLKND